MKIVKKFGFSFALVLLLASIPLSARKMELRGGIAYAKPPELPQLPQPRAQVTVEDKSYALEEQVFIGQVLGDGSLTIADSTGRFSKGGTVCLIREEKTTVHTETGTGGSMAVKPERITIVSITLTDLRAGSTEDSSSIIYTVKVVAGIAPVTGEPVVIQPIKPMGTHTAPSLR